MADLLGRLGLRRPTVPFQAAVDGVRRHRPDYAIISYTAVLVMIGLITIFAIGPQRANVLNESFGSSLSGTYFIVKQATSVLVAVASFALFAFVIKVRQLQQYAPHILAAGAIACGLLFFLGNMLHVSSVTQCALGACRWFVLPGIGTFQPAELLKFGLLLYLASFLAFRMKRGEVNDRHLTLFPVLFMLGVASLFVIILQKDLGSGLVFFSVAASMLVAAGINAKVMLGVLGVSVIAVMLLIVVAPHRMSRVMTFMQGDSASVDDKDSYHIVHAKIAIGTGGVTGVGIGNSVQAAGYLPEAINDSVFAILGETFGFVGLVFILAVFYLLLMHLLKIMDKLETPSFRLVVAGVFGWIAAHVVINTAAMTGIMPLTGITLPFLSFGGTSMLFISAALGLVFQLSQYTSYRSHTKEVSHENSHSRRGVGRPRHASRRSR